MKKQYGQLWAAYNAAQTHEKEEFQGLLRDLCAGVDEPKQERGRPRLLLSDVIFCMTLKVYCCLSYRRFMSDLRVAARQGYVTRVPQFNTISRYFEKSELRDLLVLLIVASSRPLKAVEKTFAVDSTGFSTTQFGRWMDFRYGKLQSGEKRKWIKAHLVCGVLTNIVTAVEVTDAYAHDAPRFEPLLDATRQHFEVKTVIGDKAYSSLANYKYADRKGVRLMSPFKKNANAIHGSGDPLWTRLYHFYSLNKEWFERVYHQRSNAESTNAMIKTKFGERIRSRTPVAQFNELLCKVLCHNICVTIQAYYELGIEPTFWEGEDKAA
jgi:transposase